jgi:hypothetical protein
MRALLLLVVGIVGLIELLAPKSFVRVLTRVAYRNAGDAEPRPWVHTAARIEATVLLGVALGGLFRLARSANDDQSAA